MPNNNYSGFQQTFRCYPITLLDRPELEYEGKSKSSHILYENSSSSKLQSFYHPQLLIEWVMRK
jgi:hypothetical protein